MTFKVTIQREGIYSNLGILHCVQDDKRFLPGKKACHPERSEGSLNYYKYLRAE